MTTENGETNGAVLAAFEVLPDEMRAALVQFYERKLDSLRTRAVNVLVSRELDRARESLSVSGFPKYNAVLYSGWLEGIQQLHLTVFGLADDIADIRDEFAQTFARAQSALAHFEPETAPRASRFGSGVFTSLYS